MRQLFAGQLAESRRPAHAFTIHCLTPNVLELVEGATLAEKLKQGPLPLDDAVRIARKIADALETAHEKGVV